MAVEGDIHESGCDTDDGIATFLHCRITVAMEEFQRVIWYRILWCVCVFVCVCLCVCVLCACVCACVCCVHVCVCVVCMCVCVCVRVQHNLSQCHSKRLLIVTCA